MNNKPIQIRPSPPPASSKSPSRNYTLDNTACSFGTHSPEHAPDLALRFLRYVIAVKKCKLI